jgi:hypothetical protein
VIVSFLAEPQGAAQDKRQGACVYTYVCMCPLIPHSLLFNHGD